MFFTKAVSIPETQTEVKITAVSTAVNLSVFLSTLYCLKSILMAEVALIMQSGSLKQETPIRTNSSK